MIVFLLWIRWCYISIILCKARNDITVGSDLFKGKPSADIGRGVALDVEPYA